MGAKTNFAPILCILLSCSSILFTTVTATTAAQTQDALICGALNDCESCSRKLGCGWCGSSEECIPAAADNRPKYDNTCDDVNTFKYIYLQCASNTPNDEPTASPTISEGPRMFTSPPPTFSSTRINTTVVGTIDSSLISSSGHDKEIIIGVLVGFISAVIFVILMYYCYYKKSSSSSSSSSSFSSSLSSSSVSSPSSSSPWSEHMNRRSLKISLNQYDDQAYGDGSVYGDHHHIDMNDSCTYPYARDETCEYEMVVSTDNPNKRMKLASPH